MIYAVSPEGVIGLDNRVPWHHPGDFRRFKRVTIGSAVIMGRKTFESMGKPLPGRRNLVVTSRTMGGVECVPSLEAALERCAGQQVWLIGGARIYAEGMKYADVIDVTYVPDHVTAPGAVHAPPIDLAAFEAGPLLPHEDEPGLMRRLFTRKGNGAAKIERAI
jgi:dihydrofolate reductase